MRFSNIPALTGDESRGDRHTHELLEQKFASVRNHDLDDRRTFARVLAALKRLVLQVGHGNQPALLANVDSVSVGLIHQSFLEERGSTMTHDAISFHFPETKTTISRAALHRLTSQDLHRPAPARVNLIVYHVLQALVIRRTDEDLRVQHAPRVTVVHDFVTTLLVATLVQHRRDVFCSNRGEWRSVPFLAHARRNLAHDTLHELTDCHPRRNSVRVHDDIGRDTLARERHVFLRVRHADGTLLPVTRRKLVANLRRSHRADAKLDET